VRAERYIEMLSLSIAHRGEAEHILLSTLRFSPQTLRNFTLSKICQKIERRDFFLVHLTSHGIDKNDVI